MSKTIFLVLIAVAAIVLSGSASAAYQHGWKVYENPQPGAVYGAAELNPYGPGGSKSFGPGGGQSFAPGGGGSFGPGGGESFGPGGGQSFGPGGGKNFQNPWSVLND
jgi:hypothetical protein